VAFWRGFDGVYRFDGQRTALMSFAVHPCFKPNLSTLFPTTNFLRATESVGVIHDNKYRLSVVQNGEVFMDDNNFEYVFDLLANTGNGAWVQRSNRNVIFYSSWDGEGDMSELFYVPSDTTNNFFQAEVENGNSVHKFLNVSKLRFYDVDFAGIISTKKIIAPIGRREVLTKFWQKFQVHFEPTGTHFIGIRVYTMNNLEGTLFVFQVDNSNISTLPLDDTVLMDGKTLFPSPDYVFLERQPLDAQLNKNKGVEVWADIIQDATVRADSKVNFTGSSLRTGLGNFEHVILRDVTFNFVEENL